jgi:peptidoglycan/xylan/chitin deacetylase (PgdA/CDA1 family)
MTKATVLLYHALDAPGEPAGVGSAADLSVVVGADDFANQLACLRAMGKTVVPLDVVLRPERWTDGGEPVVLTFDDGHRSNWSLALPRLVEAGVTATFYVVSGFVDHDPRYLTSAQLLELVQHGMHIGSHTVTHRFLPELSADEMRRELADSRARLEDLIGGEVLDLAIPGGHTNRTAFEIARQSGYRSIATTRVGWFACGGDASRIPRLEIRRGLSLEQFRHTFSSVKLRQLQIIEFGKACLRNTLGLGGYTRVREAAHRCLKIRR